MMLTSVVIILSMCYMYVCIYNNKICSSDSLYAGTSPHPIPCATSSLGYSIKLSCDRHLLAAAHNNIRVGPVLAVLKVRLTGISGL
jgi:mediator of RNA polymerase II transcription subunit 12